MRNRFALLICIMLLAACGGGSGGSGVNSTPTPTQKVLVSGESSLVAFDRYVSSTDNDSSILFDTSGYSQVTSGGITGGALTANSGGSASWKAVMSNNKGAILKSSVEFRYQNALLNPNSLSNTIEQSFRVASGHDITCRVEPSSTLNTSTKLINIISYSWIASNWNPTNPGRADIVTLVDGWYRLEFTTENTGGTFGDELQVKAELFSLGLTGISIPTSVGIASGKIFDQSFAESKIITSTISSVQSGGTGLIDNAAIYRSGI